MVELIIAMFPIVFSQNLIMSFVKLLAAEGGTRWWLRGVLACLSFLGAVSAASLSGDPIDFNQVSDWGQIIASTIVLGFASHYSYKAIKLA